MRSSVRFLAILLTAAGVSRAQTAAAPKVRPEESILSEDVPGGPPNPDPPPYTLLRFNENYLYLADPANRNDFFDPIKYVRLAPADPTIYLSVGGEVRQRYEAFSNPNFGTGALQRNDYLLQRITLHGDLHLGPNIRFFAQGISGLQWGEEGTASAVNENPVDLQQAFVDFQLGDPDARTFRFITRLGRFQMTFGSGRLVATRAGPNVPLKFDGLETISALGTSRLYTFLVRPAEEEKYDFDGTDDGRTFWGVYGSHPVGGPLNTVIDLYYLGLRDEGATYLSGSGTEMRHTVGTRLSGKAAGFDYDVEPVVQFGTFAGRDVAAWTIATDFGYTFDKLAWKPRLGVKLDVASGDTGGDKLGTFNPLFFKSAYFSDASFIRPSNIIDVHPSVQFRPMKGLVATIGSDVLWRYTTDDGVYATGGPVQIDDVGGGNYIGTTVEAAVQYQFNRHLVWTASYVHLFAGDYVREAGGGDVDYFGTWLTFTF
jgi:hypothetical protein